LAQYYQSCARVDAGLARLIEILRELELYDKTLIVFTSDHGMAFSGGKTTVYEPGLKVPLVVRNPYAENRGVSTEALVSHLDLTPTLLDFAGGLDAEINGPKDWIDPNELWKELDRWQLDNRDGGHWFRTYQGKSWMHLFDKPHERHWDTLFASHTFHEIQMYYPMRAIIDERYKLIWNIAHPLPYPFASDLWAASSWQAQYRQGSSAAYGLKTVGQYIQRPEFELYDLQADPNESDNLSGKQEYQDVLTEYKEKLRQQQELLEDPWILKWQYE